MTILMVPLSLLGSGRLQAGQELSKGKRDERRRRRRSLSRENTRRFSFLTSLSLSLPPFLSILINQTGLTNLKGFKDLKEFVASLEKPR